MSGGTEYVGENDSILEATKKLTQLSAAGPAKLRRGRAPEGARVIVARALALGQNPAQTRAGNMAIVSRPPSVRTRHAAGRPKDDAR